MAAQWTVLARLWPVSYLTFTETGCGRHRRRGEAPGARLPQQMYISFLPNGEVREPSYAQSVSSNSYITVKNFCRHMQGCRTWRVWWMKRQTWMGRCLRTACGKAQHNVFMLWYDQFQKSKNTLKPLKSRTVRRDLDALFFKLRVCLRCLAKRCSRRKLPIWECRSRAWMQHIKRGPIQESHSASTVWSEQRSISTVPV